MRFAVVTVVACVTLSSLTAAHARPRSQAPQLSPDCNLMMSCQTPNNASSRLPAFGMLGMPGSTGALSRRQARAAHRAERRAARQAAREQRREARAHSHRERARNANMRNAMAYAPPTGADASDLVATGAEPVERERGASSRTSMRTSLKGVVPGLASKVAQIQASCPGAHVISTVRHTRIAGTRRLSLHATGEAVDMRGNPSCVYAQLRDWPGGVSTDYARAKHIHISLSSSGREMGLRFAHGGGHKSHRHRHRRVAMR